MTMIHDPTADYILTYSGRHVSVLDPKPDQICIDDIAIGLSRKFRFGGQTRQAMTVAQHSVDVSAMLAGEDQEMRLAGLLHDASEAYMSDLPTPYKSNMPGFRELEDKLMQTIFFKFKIFTSWKHSKIKLADQRCFKTESIMLNTDVNIVTLPNWALANFLQLFHDLTK
ncbi:MAG: hypothetical protein INR69_15120 [Mucilaginibacter polytrichastri]|nr:hypothetical protein [Mucilaginibacter polytrichastri]